MNLAKISLGAQICIAGGIGVSGIIAYVPIRETYGDGMFSYSVIIFAVVLTFVAFLLSKKFEKEKKTIITIQQFRKKFLIYNILIIFILWLSGLIYMLRKDELTFGSAVLLFSAITIMILLMELRTMLRTRFYSSDQSRTPEDRMYFLVFLGFGIVISVCFLIAVILNFI